MTGRVQTKTTTSKKAGRARRAGGKHARGLIRSEIPVSPPRGDMAKMVYGSTVLCGFEREARRRRRRRRTLCRRVGATLYL
jgi:hypothetical protein